MIGGSDARALATDLGWRWWPAARAARASEVCVLWGPLPWAARTRPGIRARRVIWRCSDTPLPLPRGSIWALRAFDAVVAGDRCTAAAVRLSGAPVVAIPPGVDWPAPPPVPRAMLGATPGDLLIACALDGADERAATALWLCGLFAGGHYGVCPGCTRARPSRFDATRAAWVPVTRCGCGARLQPAAPRRVHLYLHAAGSPIRSTLDLGQVRSWLGLDRVVTLNGDAGLGAATDDTELTARLGAADLQLLPLDGPALPRALLLAATAGVVTILPDVGVPDDGLAQGGGAEFGAARLVPARLETTAFGTLRAHLDPGPTLDALRELATDEEGRAALGVAARSRSADYARDAVARRWRALISSLR